MGINVTCTAEAALKRLKEGNERYLAAKTSDGDVSLTLREKTCIEGQNPYAVIITCSDSRVIPESIFSAGIGELFVIRVAGNVIDDYQLGSVEYAIDHLGCRLVVVMGHDHCGAIEAAINHSPEGYIKFITDEIREAIGEETDDYNACCLNVRNSVKRLDEGLDRKLKEEQGLQICGAIYHLRDGRVELLHGRYAPENY